MSDLLETASAWLGGVLKSRAAQSVTYRRNGQTISGLSAVIGRTEFELNTDDAILESWQSRDFLIDAADLVLAGSTILPERGDEILQTQGGTTYVYGVIAPGDEPVWRWSDNYRTKLRIHTKQTGTE